MWTYHPWGQFVVAGLGIALMGQTTFAARFPFALVGLVTVLALYWLVRRYLGSTRMAAMACALLSLNVYWLLHARQARYYALTSLFLVLTLVAYARWQRGARWGPAVFVLAAWCWFQTDYGTVWPVFAVLFLDASVSSLLADWKTAWVPVATGGALAAGIAPFVFFYRLASRQSGMLGTWLHRLKGALFNINEYVVPLVLLLAALALVVARRHRLPPLESRLIVVACAMLVGMAVWVPTVAPMTFVRYVVMAAPVGALLTAWLVVRGLDPYLPRAAWYAVALVALTPLLCMPLAQVLLEPRQSTGAILRSELSLIGTDIFGHRPDPNRLVIEWLQKNSSPTDEILVNYEDLPMMYYLPNPIRGGVVAFRAEDDRVTPPAFAVIRRTVPFVYQSVFAREVARYYWAQVPVQAPDIRWGNNPDPEGHLQDRALTPKLLFFQRVDSTAAP
jgi:4-amino-4-deoxy-L-arabinose transferase-like glycosyltransferase